MSRFVILSLVFWGGNLLHADDLSLAQQVRLKERVPRVDKRLETDRQKGLAAARSSYSAPYLSDAALQVIVDGYPNLTSVNALCHGHVSDEGIQQICRLTRISRVSVAGVGVTDAGARQLSQKKHISRLTFRECSLTDVGLKHLAKLPKLTYLQVTQTQVTESGVAEFRKRKPDCTVHFTPISVDSDS